MIANKLYIYREYDPTKTTVLRNLFVKDSNARFDAIIAVVKKSIVDNDCFGLQNKVAVNEATPANWQEFSFKLSQDKVTKFMDWIKEQVDKGLLDIREFEQIGTSINSSWMNKYIFDSYKRGLIRARYELIKAGYNVPSINDTGGIEIAMTMPIHIDRIGLLYTRVYSDLKGITDAMDMQISRILAQGMADGDGPMLLARKLVATINGQGAGDLGLTDTLGRFIPARTRAAILARTEIIRAHHQATIQEYRNWAVEGVLVKAELVTAGDSRVCSVCETLEKGNPYTLDQIENMIPVHPQCRCCTIPLPIN